MAENEMKYWLWLQSALGPGARIGKILSFFGSPKALYESSVMQWRESGVLTDLQIFTLSATGLDDCDGIIETCQENDWEIITYDDFRYPSRLRELDDAPAVLYVAGRMLNLERCVVIGVVGTRKASPYGVEAARLLSKGMAECGAVIVSGGALGIDSAAHTGALEAEGETIVVLGSPLGSDYLRSNDELRERVVESGGALITEFPPGSEIRKNNFPIRNRIISGLSDGLLVVEAGDKSGSTITAAHAVKQGKDIFAIPASLLDFNFSGTNRLIEEGAFPATSPKAVLSHYADRQGIDLSLARTMRELYEEAHSKRKANVPPQAPQFTFDTIKKDRRDRVVRENTALSLSDDERAVYKALCDGLETAQTVAEAAGMAEAQVVSLLTLLELKGLAQSLSGGRYAAK